MSEISVDTPKIDNSKRTWLIASTCAGAVGGVAVAVPFVSSFQPSERAKAIVKATTFHDDPEMLATISRGLGEAMVGINVDDIPEPHRLAERGW